MPRIQQLSQSIINKIAAGEVIERPASVVKELVENAIDAKATRIDISVDGGGRDMIRVVDNGHGVPAADLPLALASHATSKIATADDLFSVLTMGFRGEALASIAEISRTVIRSRTPESDEGAELESVGGELSEVQPRGCPVGTSIEVRNLFFNTPVRRKFLKTTQTEFGHISEAVTRIAMPNPHVHFTLKHNDRLVLDLPSASPLERISALMGKSIAEKLIPVDSSYGDVHLSGFAGHPSESRSNAKSQYLFLNSRHIRDRALQHALTEAYRGLLMTGRHPIAFLFLTMPPDLCDVNVHPTKLEVRFQDSGKLYSQLLATLRTKFLSTDLTTRVSTDEGDDDPTSAHDVEAAAQYRQQVIDWAHGETPSPKLGTVASRGYVSSDASPSAPRSGGGFGGSSPLRLHAIDRGGEFKPFPDHAVYRPPTSEEDAQVGEAWCDAEIATPSGEAPRAVQIRNRYIVTEADGGLAIIDQHALHERILFEKMRKRLATGRIDTQNLLVPEPVDLSPSERALILESRDMLAEIGLKVEPFGGDTVLITGYPSLLSHVRGEELLRTIVERLAESGKMPDRAELMDGLLETMACKAAIKAGDPLSPSEIEALLQQRTEIDDQHHCPHGRPSTLVFSCEELDKQFKRT